ncbi:MAG: hypothetical protein JXJ04_23950 [Spirochaetales bacterium]|nr:hypothetical protein [Spirochaetales bacterium]
MKSKLICFLFALFIFLPAAVFATPVVVAGTWEVEFPKDSGADGINITGVIQSENDQMPKLKDYLAVDSAGNPWRLVEFSLVQDEKNPVDWKFVAKYQARKIVEAPEKVRLGIDVVVINCNIIKLYDTIWTKVKIPFPEPDPDPWLSFDIYRTYGNLMTTIMNCNRKEYMMVDNLEFAVNDVQVPLAEMGNAPLGEQIFKVARLDENEKLEWIPYGKTFYLAPGQGQRIYMKELGIDLKPGQFLLLRAKDPKKNTVAWGQHQEP